MRYHKFISGRDLVYDDELFKQVQRCCSINVVWNFTEEFLSIGYRFVKDFPVQVADIIYIELKSCLLDKNSYFDLTSH